MIHYPAEDPLPDEFNNLVKVDTRVYGRSIVNFYQKKKTGVENNNN